jgi:murein tripeptide amidase MpaA
VEKKRKIIIVTFLLLTLSGLVPSLLAHENTPQDIVSVEKNPRLEKKLREMDLDLLFEWEGRIFILVSREDLDALDKVNIPYIYESYKFPALHQGRLHVETDINGAYHSYKELEADLEALQRSYPELAQLTAIGTTLEKRKIYALKISADVSRNEGEPEILFLGCHHAREWISVEVPFLLAKYLLENYAGNPDVRRLANESEVWIVPLVNPDGLEYSIHFYRYWRKNRRLNADGSYGVDLNRNYGYAWGFDDSGSSPESASEVYRGSAPFSEPETQAIRDFVALKHFRAMITYHSYAQEILYPWGYTNSPTDKEQLLNRLAVAMSHLIKAVNGRSYTYGEAGPSLYLTNGDVTDWIFGTTGIPAYTIELPPIDELQGGFFNAEKDIVPIFNENVPAALYLINWAIQNSGSEPRKPQAQDRRATSNDKIKEGKKPSYFRNNGGDAR